MWYVLMGQVFGASKPSPSFKWSKTKQLGMWWVLVNIVQRRGSQSHVDTRLRCFALLQWMIVGLLKENFKWSLAVANKGKSSWCFYVKKITNYSHRPWSFKPWERNMPICCGSWLPSEGVPSHCMLRVGYRTSKTPSITISKPAKI